jgi:iron complex outermembrane recepter protein
MSNIKNWRRVLPGGLLGAAAYIASGSAMAADAATESPVLEEVVITGSSIKQNVDNSSLPVTIITAEDIAKTGLGNVTDLIQNMPAMQGFVPASSSVNGGGGGVTTAALHSLPSKYTLTLIDGQRVAPFALGSVQGGGFGVDIGNIPLSAVERVEVLTDGASALYGADAIAGVVNFVLKKDTTEGNAYYNILVPQSSGGGSWNAGISKGFGSLANDGFNFLVTYSHDVQYKLQASQRAVSSNGAVFPFAANGQNYQFFNATSNTEPGNLTINGHSFSPYLLANGNCGGALRSPVPSATGTTCRFNYAATVEDIPGSTRDSGMVKGTVKVGENQSVWGEVLLSQVDLTAQYAPPAQPLGLSPTNLPLLWNTYVVPYLNSTSQTVGTATTCAAANVPKTTICNATLGYRAISAGGRADDYGTTARQIVLGWNGDFAGWSLSGTFLDSHGRATDTAAGGYLDYDQFTSAVASGAYDPVLGTGSSSLKTAILSTKFSTADSDLKTLQIGAQHEVFDLPGGPSIVSVGAENDWTKYTVNYSPLSLSGSGYSTEPASTDVPLGGNSGAIPFEANRTNWGLFGEWLLPVEKNLDVTGSVRYDNYAKVNSSTVFGLAPDATGLIPQLPAAKLGNTFDDTTYKISTRWTPIDMLSFRGSYGTGFRAPALGDIAGALAFNGSTAGTYACPFPGSPQCIPGSAQYDLLSGPNGNSGEAGLKPEKSNQYTLGVRVEPIRALSLGADYWNVKITNQIESFGIAEKVGFENPQQYASLFVNPYLDPVGKFQTIAFEQVPFNGGVAHYSGVDWNFNYHTAFNWGKFSAAWSGTRVITQNYTNGPGMPTLTDLGVYGPDQQVVFKWISNLVLSLETGAWVNTLTAHYKSGYTDESYIADDGVIFHSDPTAPGNLGAPADFSGLKVPSYTTFDWQTSYNLVKAVNLTVGVQNLANKAPPLSLQTGGGGNQIGYDGRYYDPVGRAYYAKVSVTF